MTLLALRMLFRKGGTPSAIVAIALLVSILASINSMVNHINPPNPEPKLNSAQAVKTATKPP